MDTTKPDPQAALIPSRISRAQRRRFSNAPPYSSVRWFMKVMANWSSRYPQCMAWTSMPGKPHCWKKTAVAIIWSIFCRIWSLVRAGARRAGSW